MSSAMAVSNQTPPKPRFYYGWYVLGVGMLSTFMASGTSQLFMSIMLKPLTEEFGWSRTAITGALTLGTLLAGLLAILFGRLTDRYGPRVLTSLGAFITAGMYLVFTRFVELWQFYVIFIIVRIIASNTMAKVVVNTAAVNWFRRMRGRALGFLAMASPLGTSVLAICGQQIMEGYGWRTVFMVFALATLILVCLPGILILRRRPEDIGLLPDGEIKSEIEVSSPSREQEPQEFSWTLKEAIRTPTLWFLVTSIVVSLMVNAGIGFHQVAYYTDIGIATKAAVLAMSVYAFSGAFANAIWGFLTEHFSERYLAIIVMLLTAVAILFLQTIQSTAGAFVFAIWFGLTSRGEDTIVNIIVAHYYGRDSYGTINGFMYPFHMLGLALGPITASLSFDLTGSYRAVFISFTVLAILAAVLLWLAKKPPPPVRT